MGRERLASTEGEELIREIRRPPSGGFYLAEALRGLRALRDGCHRQLRVREDGQEEVVEVVSDAAGELADGFHLLGLVELRLGRSVSGNVAGDPVDVPRDGIERGAPGEHAVLAVSCGDSGFRSP